MKTKTILSTAPSFLLPALGLLAAGGAFAACTADFKTECPEGTEQVAGGGDVGDACREIAGGGGSGAGGPAGGNAGAPGGGSGGSGVGGSGTGGSAGAPVPPGGVCGPGSTKCEGDAQQTCGENGQWGASSACDIACDAAGSTCVVPQQLALGNGHACARLSDGTVRCWGANTSGQLGNGEGPTELKPRQVEGLQNVIELVSAQRTTCATLADKTALCWGNNNRKKIHPTLDTKRPVPLEGAANVKQIAVGDDHICILNESGVMLCKGSNDFAQLGIGDNGSVDSSVFVAVQTSGRTPKQIGITGRSSLAAYTDNSVQCWGAANGCGGAASGGTIFVPTQVPSVTSIGALFAQGAVPCAVRFDGQVTCWGPNDAGQLGRGTRSDEVLAPGLVVGLSAVQQVASGGTESRSHVCAVTEDKSLFCWGANHNLQLGSACGPALPCQTRPEDQLSYVPTPSKVAVAGGVEEVRSSGINSISSFSCVRTSESKVLCWGANDIGQLGTGAVGNAQAIPTPIVWKLKPPPLTQTAEHTPGMSLENGLARGVVLGALRTTQPPPEAWPGGQVLGDSGHSALAAPRAVLG